jgi:hypothetical protein
MIDQDRTQFFKLIANVSAFYKQDFSEFAGGVWWEAMKPYDFAAVADALNRHCVNPDVGQFMPKPADVVRMLQGSTQDSALVAWAKVDRAIRTVGTYRSVVFDDPLIHRVLTEMGGWIEMGKKTEEEWPFLRNEFVNRYRGYRGRNQIPDYSPVLIGIAEAQNSKQGHAIEPPMLLGDAKRAEKVMIGGSSTQILAIEQMKPQRAAHALEWVREGMSA